MQCWLVWVVLIILLKHDSILYIMYLVSVLLVHYILI